jgi:hypothetical protein
MTDHRYLDESGDTSFYGKGKDLIIGKNGVSLSFSIGMLKLKGKHDIIRQQVVQLQQAIISDPYLNVIPSIKKKIDKKGFCFHATDDPPEVRERFFKFIKAQKVTLEIYVARKEMERYERIHNGNEADFYADILSHLIKSKLKSQGKLVLNIAERGNTTKNKVLQNALEIAKKRAAYKVKESDMLRDVIFNVQNHYTEPLLNIADYLCWAVQRVFEIGDLRYYDFIKEKITLIVDLYDTEKYVGFSNYYNPSKKPLTSKNKLSPPCT